MTTFYHDTSNGPVGDEMLPLWNQLHSELIRQLPDQPELTRCVFRVYMNLWNVVTKKLPHFRIDMRKDFVPPNGIGRGIFEDLAKIYMMIAVRDEREWAASQNSEKK